MSLFELNIGAKITLFFFPPYFFVKIYYLCARIEPQNIIWPLKITNY